MLSDFRWHSFSVSAGYLPDTLFHFKKHKMLYLYDLWHFVQMPKIIEIREELYMADMWDEIYFDAKRLFGNATGYENINSKAKTLKLAANELILLPDWYPGKEELLEKINQYARCCGIDLDKVSGYEV